MPLVSGTELGPFEILAAIGAGGGGDAYRPNHSKIVSTYKIDEASGSRFLVIELVDGETLADRLKRGALPVRKPSSSQKKSAKRWTRRTAKRSFTATSSRQGSVPISA